MFSENVRHYMWMTAIAMALSGVQFLYSIQFAAGPLLFTSNLCLDAGTVNIILATAGPLSGFIVQPIVGAFSDNNTGKFGRRRPYVLIGTIGSIVGLLGIAFCQMIGSSTVDLSPTDCSKGSSGHKVAIGIAVSCLWLMNISVNIVMGPARAIINDLVEKDYLVAANSIATAVMAVSAIVANLVGAAFYGPGDDFFHRQPVLMLFSVGSVVMAFTSGITLVFARERQHRPEAGAPVKTVAGTFVDIYRGFRYMPKALFLVAMLYFLSWFAYTPLMTNQTTYFVNNVYGINSTAHHSLEIQTVSKQVHTQILFAQQQQQEQQLLQQQLQQQQQLEQDFFASPDFPPISIAPTGIPVSSPHAVPVGNDPSELAKRRGQAMGFYSLAIFAGVQFAYSLVSPSVISLIGLKWAYFLPQFVATVSYILAPFAANSGYKHWPVPVIITIFAIVAPNFMAFNSVPFALVSGITSGASGGLYMGVLNSASVVAQTVTNSLVSVIISHIPKLPIVDADGKSPQNVAWGIAFGGIFSAIACIWCLIFISDGMVKSSTTEDGEVSEKKPLIQAEDREPTSLDPFRS